MEETVVISAQDLVIHTVLSRRKLELEFRRNYLMRNGSSSGDAHVMVLDNALKDVETTIAPISNKMDNASLMQVMINRTQIESLTVEINKYDMGQMINAMKTKTGELYNKMKSRSQLNKVNFDNKEELADLTIILSTMPRQDAEKIRNIVESSENYGDGDAIDLSSISDDKCNNLSSTINRLGIGVDYNDGELSFNSTEEQINTEESRVIKGTKVWISKDNLDSFDNNEQLLINTIKGIQALTAEKQVTVLSPEKEEKFDTLQNDYLKFTAIRTKFLSNGQRNELTLKLDSNN